MIKLANSLNKGNAMASSAENLQNLFSYGTLQTEPVQLATFGRKLDGKADSLPGYELSTVAIDDPEVVATSGKSHHPIIRRSAGASGTVKGTVLKITWNELMSADKYEVSAYKRVEVTLSSGAKAWAYVAANDISGP
jgi:gamma-glutamylcyclotransferase (GGCT)/AIG2-like uncharacterized protein YtfP